MASFDDWDIDAEEDDGVSNESVSGMEEEELAPSKSNKRKKGGAKAKATGKAKAKKGQLDKFLGSKSKLRWLRAGHPLTTRERLITAVHHHTEVNEDHWHRMRSSVNRRV